jgi:glycosyltransferase involved in cell wall biosynthesis
VTLHPAALIAVFNCADRIGSLVRRVIERVPDVLVVDDGSHDNTPRAALEAGARLVVLRENRGKAVAMRAGLAVLLGEEWSHILMLDGDGQHDPDDIPLFFAAAEDADFVLGNRLWKPEAVPHKRYWTNFVGTRALELMTGYPVEDSQCGFRLVAAPFLRRMGLVGRRYAGDTEILVRAGKLRARFAHVPVQVIYDGAASHYMAVSDTVHIVLSAVRFKVDEGDLRRDPGPQGWRRMVPQPEVIEPPRRSGSFPHRPLSGASAVRQP